jgi:hypothetical protein
MTPRTTLVLWLVLGMLVALIADAVVTTGCVL